MKNLSIVLLSVFSLCFIGCTKVSPEDPAISLKTRKKRIQNEWELEKLLNQGTEVTDSNISDIELDMTEVYIGQEQYKWTVTYTNGITVEEEGEWRIDPSDKRKLLFEQEDEFAYVGSDYVFIEGDSKEFYLHRVAKNELWLRRLDEYSCTEPNEFRFKKK